MQLKWPETEPEPRSILGIPEFVKCPGSLEKKAASIQAFFIIFERMPVNEFGRRAVVCQ